MLTPAQWRVVGPLMSPELFLFDNDQFASAAIIGPSSREGFAVRTERLAYALCCFAGSNRRRSADQPSGGD